VVSSISFYHVKIAKIYDLVIRRKLKLYLKDVYFAKKMQTVKTSIINTGIIFPRF